MTRKRRCDYRTECRRLHGPENYVRSASGIPTCIVCRRALYLRGRSTSTAIAEIKPWMTDAQRRVASHPVFAGRVSIPDSPNGCWDISVGRNEFGYGRIRWQGRVRYAHRFAFSLAVSNRARMPEAVCHRCDRSCCINPEHLRAGTLSDNTAEMWAKGRQNVLTKLDVRSALLIRARFTSGGAQARKLAAEYGIAVRTVYRVASEKDMPVYLRHAMPASAAA